MNKNKFKILIVLTMIFHALSWPTNASQGLYEYQSTQAGGLFTKVDQDTYQLIAVPTKPGQIFTEKRQRFHFREGILGLSFEKRELKTFQYSRDAGEYMYYLLKGEPMPLTYTDIDGQYTSYLREDLSLDLLFTSNKWSWTLGTKVILGSEPFQLQMTDGLGGNSKSELFQYSLSGKSNLWYGTRLNQTAGLAGFLQVEYQPTERLRVTLAGDDLGSQLVWRDVKEYRGMIDLDVLTYDQDGLPVLDAPFQGDYFTEHGFLRVKIPARWQGVVQYQGDNYWLQNWVSYQDQWEWGAALGLQHNLDYSLGISYQREKWLYQLGIGYNDWQLNLAFNSVSSKKLTNVLFGLQLPLL